MENDSAHAQGISLSRTPSQVDAHAAVGTCTCSKEKEKEEKLRQTPQQMELHQESLAEHEVQRENLEAEMKFQRKRRSFLRHVQKDISQTINFYGVVLVLLVSVTFIGFLQPPGGLDDEGYMKQSGHQLNRYIVLVYGSFFLAVAGICVCMSCVAFVLPRNTEYARPTLAGAMSWKYPAVCLNSLHPQMLDNEVKANDKIARTLKVAHIHEILANFFFVLSVGFSVYAFIASSLIVMNSKQKHSFYDAAAWAIVQWMFNVVALLYMVLLFWHIVRAIIDLSLDSVDFIKRLPSKVGSGVRFNSRNSLENSLREFLQNSRTRL